MSSFHVSGVPTLLAVETDGHTLVNIEANPSTGELDTSGGISGTDNGPETSRKDENHVSTLMATSSEDGVTPVVVYGTSNGSLLIDAV